jgi:serine/threonine protein kinase
MTCVGTTSTDHRPRLGSYALERLLGEGSMGQVYEARHVKLDRLVAIKMLRPERAHDAQLVQRFFQEARTVNRINHPHIVGIHDFVEDTDDEGQPRAYCVMEYLEGVTLTQLLQHGTLPLERIFRVIDQVTQALSAAHQVGVVHRDLKPDNIFVSTSEAGEDFVRVLDFGVAKLMRPDPDVGPGRTHDGAIIGTPKYMAPEQAASLEVDFRTDVYGVGTILYELLTGRPPFSGDAFGPLMASIITQPVEPPGPYTVGGEEIPAALENLVMRCLEKDPSLRPETMTELRMLLASCPRVGRERHRRTPAALFASAALLGLGAVALLVRPAIEAPSEPAVAPVLELVAPAPAPPAQSIAPLPLPERTIAPPRVEQNDANPTTARSPARSSARPAAKVNAARVSRDAVLNPFEP